MWSFYILWLFHQYFQCGLHMYCGLFPCCLFLDTPRGCPWLDSETVSGLNQKKWFRSLAMLESVYEKVTSLTPLWAKSPPNFLHTFARLKSWQATSYPISRQFLNDLWGLHTVHLFQFSWNVKKKSCVIHVFANVVLRKRILIREVADIAVCRGKLWFIERCTYFTLTFSWLWLLGIKIQTSNFNIYIIRPYLSTQT